MIYLGGCAILTLALRTDRILSEPCHYWLGMYLPSCRGVDSTKCTHSLEQKFRLLGDFVLCNIWHTYVSLLCV